MARMIPDVDASSIQVDSEALVYSALKSGLSKKYTVFHSYPWLRLWRGDKDKALLEGEADFVIVHPQHGLLVLEVKGGHMEEHGGEWFRQARHGLKPVRNPFEQARRNTHALLDIVRDYSHGSLGKADLAHGYAVVFPHLEYRGRLPSYADRAIILSQKHLSDIGPAILEAMERWSDSPRPLDAAQYEQLLSSLMPKFEFFRPLGPDLLAAEERIAMLTESQAQVARSILGETSRALVRGCAGSGKTELALRSALRFADAGTRTLFVCFNRELALWLEERVRNEHGEQPLLEIINFHRLARKLAKRAGIAWESLEGGRGLDSNFWEEEVPELLGQAACVLEAQGEQVRYGAIVVDEGQDFRPMWWLCLEEELLMEGGALQVFYDPEQSLWDRESEIPLPFDLKFGLDTNCRNTKRVTSFSSAIADVETQVFAYAPEGLTVQVRKVATQAEQADMVRQRVIELLERGLRVDQLVLIGPGNLSNGSLANLPPICGHPLTSEPSIWRAGDGLLVTTARSFKGLEAPAVIVYDLGGLGNRFTTADLYVACTRSVTVLEVIVHDDELAGRLRQATKPTSKAHA